ncbi:MAG: DedA family protein [Rhizobiaceae bacterium]|nr:DedA family protein [Rhizobiaceae bacterium]
METLRTLVEHYGLAAIFLGCLAEGESFAILGGFLAHQAILSAEGVLIATFLGSFLGDCLFFLAGRHYADHPIVVRLRHKRGFSHAYRLVNSYPNLFVLGNRFVYGLRLVGGVAAGMAHIPLPRFLVLNALSSVLWSAVFVGLGYFFGLGAETLIGDTLRTHHRLLIGIAIGLGAAIIAGYAAHRVARKEPREPD